MDHKWCKVCSGKDVMTAVGKTLCQICKDSEGIFQEEARCYLVPIVPLWYFMEADLNEKWELVWIGLASAEEAFKKHYKQAKLVEAKES